MAALEKDILKKRALEIQSREKEAALTQYRAAVRTLAEAESSHVFQNRNKDHASIVIETIIEVAKKSVNIFDDELSGDISDSSSMFLDILRSSVTTPSPKMIQIVVERKRLGSENGKVPESNIEKTVRQLCSTYPDKIAVRIASPDFIKAVKNVRVEEFGLTEHIHFTVGDAKSYRLEFPKGTRQAVCSFNDPKTASLLDEVFETQFNGCEDYFGGEEVGDAAVHTT